MAEGMQGILAEAKKGKYSSIRDSLSEDDVSSVWENVSSFVEKQMFQQKGVQIMGLGTFTFSQKKLDIGNNKFIMIQRPVFNISEKFAQTHALQFTRYHVPGQIPVVPLNYAALSFESPFDRDTVESCCKEILNAVARAVGARKNVELSFAGIGRLSIRESKVKMKFFKEFVNHMDGSGKLVDSMQNRPGTVDSVISERSMSRPATSNTLVLPKISGSQTNNVGGLAPVTEQDEATDVPPDLLETQEANMDLSPQALAETLADTLADDNQVTGDATVYATAEGIEEPELGDADTAAAISNLLNEGEVPDHAPVEIFPTTIEQEGRDGDDLKKVTTLPVRSASRLAMPLPKASGVSLLDDLVLTTHSPKPMSPPTLAKSSPAPLQDISSMMPHPPRSSKPSSPAHLAPIERSKSMELIQQDKEKVLTPPGTACGHPNAGQELCYLCHQRARRNIPVSFSEERRKREEEEEILLQQYQTMKDAEETLNEHERLLSKRHDLQKMAAFNQGVAEAVIHKKKARDTDFHRSYIFQRRPLTPPRFPKQNEYCKELSKQVETKDQLKQKRKSDEAFLERLEQVQLAEDLAAQRELYLKDKADQQDAYRNGLETQLRFKPLPLPPREPDSIVFGLNDMNNEKMAEKRRRAYDLFREQQDFVAQRKREAILKRLAEQKDEEEVLERTKRELIEDRANRYHMRYHCRRRLEENWSKAAGLKRGRELEEHLRTISPGLLVHEQCDKYHRCQQCQRHITNCGESNIWSESRYIPGSRLIV